MFDWDSNIIREILPYWSQILGWHCILQAKLSMENLSQYDISIIVNMHMNHKWSRGNWVVHSPYSYMCAVCKGFILRGQCSKLVLKKTMSLKYPQKTLDGPWRRVLKVWFIMAYLPLACFMLFDCAAVDCVIIELKYAVSIGSCIWRTGYPNWLSKFEIQTLFIQLISLHLKLLTTWLF